MRYATTIELADAARDAITVPLQSNRLAATKAAPVPPPSPRARPQAQPMPKRPGWRRARVLIPVVVAVVLLIGCGVFAAVKVSHHNSPNANPTAALPPNTGPFTGTYRADFAAGTGFDGQPREGLPAAAETWGVRSVCRPGCVATASRRSGDTTGVSTLVFDYVGGRWLAVGVSSGTCQNTPSELWKVITLNSRPDGTLSGDFSTTTINTCNVQRAVTFTRTGDVDVDSLPDPATQAPRLHSAAEGLQGHYHDTQTYANGSKLERDVAAHTDCLRAGDRCMSFFHGPDLVLPLVFGGGNWTLKFDGDSKCPSGDSAHLKITAEYPLPQPSQDPITLLTGHGQQEKTVSSCSYSLDFDQKFVRTGD